MGENTCLRARYVLRRMQQAFADMNYELLYGHNYKSLEDSVSHQVCESCFITPVQGGASPRGPEVSSLVWCDSILVQF